MQKSARELGQVMERGRAFEPDVLAGWTYHGTSLGLPAWIERLTWKTFAKAFVREPDGTVRGWNVRCEQAEPPAWRPRIKAGVPVTFGHFVVVRAPGVVLDYGRGGNRRGDPVGAVRDPLVALDERGERLLGRTLLAVAGRQLPTPSYFLLERGAAVTYVAAPYLPRGRSPSVVLGSR